MNQPQRMPDFSYHNKTVTVGEAVAELERCGVPAERIRFRLVDVHTAYGEIVTQTPAAATPIEPRQAITLHVGWWAPRIMTFSKLLHRLVRNLEVPEHRHQACQQLRNLWADLEEQGARGLHENFAKVTDALDVVFETGDQAKIADVAAWLRDDDFARALERCFTPEIQRKTELNEQRFSFFARAREERIDTEGALSQHQREDWENFFVHMVAQLDRKARIDHNDLLELYIRHRLLPFLLKQFSLREQRGSSDIDEDTLLPTQWTALGDDLRRFSNYPISARGLVGLLRTSLKLPPNRIKWRLQGAKLVVDIGRKWSSEDDARVRWIDYLFRPISMAVEYVWAQRTFVLDRPGSCELDHSNVLV